MAKRKHESQQQSSTEKESKTSSKKHKQQPVTVRETEAVISVGGNFQAIPIHSSSSIHYIYARHHSTTTSTTTTTTTSTTTSSTLPSDRTLFVANLPIDSTPNHLKEFFKKAGIVQRVKLQSARNIGWIQKEEDDDEEEEQEEEEEEQDEDEEQQRKGSKGKGKDSTKKKSNSNKSGPPKVIPLPSLNPRTLAGGNPFLPTCSSAHIIFLDPSSLQRCLTLIGSNELPKVWKDPREGFNKVKRDELERESLESSLNQPRKKIRTAEEMLNHHSNKSGQSLSPPPLGLDYFLKDFKSKRPSLEEIKRFSDSTIENYEWKRANPTKVQNGRGGIEGVSIGPNGELLDQDGFTIVQSGGKYGRAKGAEGNNVGMVRNRKTKDDVSEASRNRKKKTKELEDFYRFQMREKKREQLANLRAQFEADKEKVKKLKASRSFKPF